MGPITIFDKSALQALSIDETVWLEATFALLDECVVADGVARLGRDLADLSWHRRYASLLTLPQLDVGYRLLVAELAPGDGSRSALAQGKPP
jgi:hypothetical protein